MIRHQVFVVAAGGAIDFHAQRTTARQGVVRCNKIHATRTRADRNGDELAVGQRHYHRRTGHWRIDRRGVNHGAAFDRAGRGGQGDGAVVDGVGYVGDCWRLVGHQVFEVATGGLGDAGVDFASVFVDVILGGGEVHRTAGGALGDVDDCAVAQRHGHCSASGIGQGRGVDDRTTLGDRTGGAQAQAGGVGRIGDGGDRRRRAGDDFFEVAAVVAGNRCLDFSAVDVRRIGRCSEVHRTGGGAGGDVDHCAVAQLHGHRRVRRVAQGGGVGDLATFAHGVAGRQGQGRRVHRVFDGGAH